MRRPAVQSSCVQRYPIWRASIASLLDFIPCCACGSQLPPRWIDPMFRRQAIEGIGPSHGGGSIQLIESARYPSVDAIIRCRIDGDQGTACRAGDIERWALRNGKQLVH